MPRFKESELTNERNETLTNVLLKKSPKNISKVLPSKEAIRYLKKERTNVN